MKSILRPVTLAWLVPFAAATGPAAMAQDQASVEALRQEIESLRQNYENRVADLERRLNGMQAKTGETAGTDASGKKTGNAFNPAINLILNGKLSAYSASDGEIAGFAVSHEGERGREGIAIDESELNFSANVDDKFYGSLTAAIVREDGEDIVELEEAYVQTLPGTGLPGGLSVKAGRAFWTVGYLNEHHAHADDFADRPLPYRVFLNRAYNDDGVQVSYILPTGFYSEVGGGLFRGDDFPFGGSGESNPGAWSAYARVGSDIGPDQSWRLGAYVLAGEAGERMSNEDDVTFIGDNRIYAADLRYTWAPTGNPRERELTLQAEYFQRHEDGTYEDTNAGTGQIAYDDSQSGWYLQSVYRFLPQWRAGLRYSELQASSVPAGLAGSALDGGGHDPRAYAVMLDWSNSEFSRLRFQYNNEEMSAGNTDHQFLVQYIMSIGSHGAHAY